MLEMFEMKEVQEMFEMKDVKTGALEKDRLSEDHEGIQEKEITVEIVVVKEKVEVAVTVTKLQRVRRRALS